MSHFRPPASILMIRFGTHLWFSEQLCFPTTPAFFKVFFWCGPFWKSWLNLLQYYFCFMFCFFSYKACGILTPRPGIKLVPPCIGSLCFALDQLSCYIASLGNSLVVQWLKLCASTSRGPGSVPGWEIKIPQTTKKKIASLISYLLQVTMNTGIMSVLSIVIISLYLAQLFTEKILHTQFLNECIGWIMPRRQADSNTS